MFVSLIYLFSCIASCLCIGHVYFFMLLYFIECMFGWSFALLCHHCSHFYMTVLVYDQVVHMFHIMFTWSQCNCYIILVLLLLVLPWGSNVFCASVLGYRYICLSASQEEKCANWKGKCLFLYFGFFTWVCTHVAFISF